MCGDSVFVMPWCPCALNFSKRPHDLTIISLVHRIIPLMHDAANSCGLAGRRAGTTTGLRCSQTLWPRCLMLFFFNSYLAFVQAAAAASIAGSHTHPKSGIHEAAGSGNLDVVQGYLIDSNFDSSLTVRFRRSAFEAGSCEPWFMSSMVCFSSSLSKVFSNVSVVMYPMCAGAPKSG